MTIICYGIICYGVTFAINKRVLTRYMKIPVKIYNIHQTNEETLASASNVYLILVKLVANDQLIHLEFKYQLK